MKKRERIEMLHKRAPELAESGDCIDWHSVEIALISEGYPEARTELDRTYLRDELNKKCNIAKSEAEVQNRNDFADWIGAVEQDIVPKLKEAYPQLSSYSQDKMLSLSIGDFQIDFEKQFGSKGLRYRRYFVDGDQRYKTLTYSHLDKEFQNVRIDDLSDLVDRYLVHETN